MPDEPPTAEAAAPEPVPAPPPPEVKPAEPSEDWETRFKYLLADFENFRKRGARDKELARLQASSRLLRELLPIFEAFERAREAASGHLDPADPIRSGIELLGKEWTSFFQGEGVEPVAAVGDSFRAADHEAVLETPATKRHPSGSITEVVQQGYRFPGGLLRPAKVVVARRVVSPPVVPPEASPAGPVEPGGEEE
jgi:molecular chaperone GrpE